MAQATPAADLKTALIIGNDAYPGAPLQNSVNDARAVARELTALGFEVTLLVNVPFSAMANSFEQFHKKISGRKDVIAIVYYSGHGMQQQDRNLLLGTDINVREVEQGAVDMQRFLSLLKPASNSTYLVILDACREYVRELKPGLAPLDAPPGTLIAFSTAPGRLASDGNPKDGNGVYTKHLIKYLQVPGIPVESVFKQVRASVIAETKGEQVPWENSAMLRDFYFMGAAAGTLKTAKVSPLPVGVEPAGAASRLTTFYAALALLKDKPFVSPGDLAPINQVTQAAYGVTLEAGEAKHLAERIFSIGALTIDLPDYIREKYGIDKGRGALVQWPHPGGVAERLGAQEGDIILQLNGKNIRSTQDLEETFRTASAGETFTAMLLRDGEQIDAKAVVERTPVDSLILAAALKAFYDKNYKRAVDLGESMANAGHPDGYGTIATLAYTGYGYNGPNFPVAHKFATRGAELGNLPSKRFLSRLYFLGRGVRENKPLAIDITTRSAQAGELWALAQLGIYHLSGDGVPQDYAKARLNLEKAAYRGYFDAIAGMARIHEEGLGVAKNTEEAIRWWQRLKDIGDPTGKQLADMKIKSLTHPLGGVGGFLDALKRKP